MKIYFDATPTGLPKYKENYDRIAKQIDKLGHEHTSDFIINFRPQILETPKKKWPEHYVKIMKSVEAADVVVVVEITKSSMSIGILVHKAFELGKPVVAMHTKDRRDIFIGGAEDVESKLIMVEYTLNDLEEKLTEALEYAEEWLDCRFTLILDNRIKRHLDRVAQKGKTRSEYIRNLIEKDMKK